MVKKEYRILVNDRLMPTLRVSGSPDERHEIRDQYLR
jgi:hypothetical protein